MTTKTAATKTAPANQPGDEWLHAKTLCQSLECDLNSCRQTLDRFTISMIENPAYAFSWSTDAFTAAARFEVLTYVKNCIEAHPTRDVALQLFVRFTGEVHRFALYPPRSTSVQSNLMEQESAAAKAQLTERLKCFLEA